MAWYLEDWAAQEPTEWFTEKLLIPFVPALRCRRSRHCKLLPCSRKDNDEKASSSGLAASTGSPCTPNKGHGSVGEGLALISTANLHMTMQVSHRQQSGLGRREVLLHSAQWPLLGALISGTDDAKTILNSVLGKAFVTGAHQPL